MQTVHYVALFLSIIALSVLLCTKTQFANIIKEKFSRKSQEVLELEGTFDLIENFNEIKMFGYMSCPYCKKAREMFEAAGEWDNVNFIDTSTKMGAEHFEKESKDKRVPFFKSTKTGKTFVGHPGSIKHLSQALAIKESFSNASNAIEWYGSMSCPYCVKTQDMFDNSKMKTKFHNLDTKSGVKAAKKINFNGSMPLIINTRNGKKYEGYPGSIKKLLNKIS